jgi:hypothetical protein
MRTAVKLAPALPPVPRNVASGPFVRAFAAWKAGWTAYAAALGRAERVAPLIPWPIDQEPTGRHDRDVPCCS